MRNKYLERKKNNKRDTRLRDALKDFKPNANAITKEDIIKDVEANIKRFEPPNHNDLLDKLLEKVVKIDFTAMVFPDKWRKIKEYKKLEAKGLADEDKNILEKAKALKQEVGKMKMKQMYIKQCVIEVILDLAKKHKWGLAKQHDFIYLYNGAYWKKIDSDRLKYFLGKAAEKMGYFRYDANDYNFKDALYKQFIGDAYFREPERPEGVILINLQNGTYEITPTGHRLREFRQEDFLKYQLPFDYNPNAKASLFTAYLQRVQPDLDRQKVLSE